MQIFNLEQIKSILDFKADFDGLLQSQKQGFTDFCKGLYDIPLPTHLHFSKQNGDTHIKCGFKELSDEYYIKVAGTVNNGSKTVLNGMILAISKSTGEIKLILKDEGFLTNLRTAITACLVSSLTPFDVEKILIIGSGNLGKLIYDLVPNIFDKASIVLYSKRDGNINLDEEIKSSQLIFTATNSHSPIIRDEHLIGKKHVISLGADDEKKQEIHQNAFLKTDLIIVDSKVQALSFGNVCNAIKHSTIKEGQVNELGLILNANLNQNLIITSLVGMAFQDIAICEFILQKLSLTK